MTSTKLNTERMYEWILLFIFRRYVENDNIFIMNCSPLQIHKRRKIETPVHQHVRTIQFSRKPLELSLSLTEHLCSQQ